MNRTFIKWPVLLASLVLGLAACRMGHREAAAHQVEPYYDVSVVRTRYGVPHVTASNWGSLGFGYGYAIAEDNLCVLAEAIVTFRGQRSRYFGAQGSVQGASTLGNPNNLDADFFFRALFSDTRIASYRAAQPSELDKLTVGFAAGYSRYVREISAGGHPGRHAACRDTKWLQPITAEDVYRRMYALALGASSTRFITPIAQAQPPTRPVGRRDEGSRVAPASTAQITPPSTESTVLAGVESSEAELGSNMMGFGRAATGVGQGLLFGNPHWFWDSVDRFHQVHLKIPGQIDVEGASIVGVPLVLIGFNHNVAWSHTVSTAARFTLYRLKLVTGDPTSYVYDGQIRHMQADAVTVDVRNDDGTLGTVQRTLYHSHFGPMLATSWGDTEALTLRDVNADNDRSYRNWLRWDRASNLDEFIRIQREEVAVPWVNTIAVGRNDARVWYADIGAIPNVSDAKQAACGAGESTLDGSRSECEWDVDSHSPQAGTFAAEKLPQLIRDDYAANMNDSYWLANAKAPLTGYPRILGEANHEQSLRTRLGHILVRQRLVGVDGLPGLVMSATSLQQIVLNSRNLSAELFLKDVLATLCSREALELAGRPSAPVDTRPACTALQGWDRTGNPDSRGAQVWDAIWEQVRTIPAAERYSIPFDPAAPLDTPRGLNVANPRVMQAVLEGVRVVSHSTIPFEAARSTYQFVPDAAGTPIPLAGGCATTGYFTVVCSSIGPNGASVSHHGNSYLQIVAFTAAGVEPYTLLVPSESTDPASSHFRDYTRAYSAKEWVRAPFTDAEIGAETLERVQLRTRDSPAP